MRPLKRARANDSGARASGAWQGLGPLLGRHAQHTAVRVVREQPQRAVGPLAYVADALAEVGEQALLTDDALAVEHEAVQCLTSQRAQSMVSEG